MRIHTSTLTRDDLMAAADHAGATVVRLTEHGSRQRDHAFEVKLEGDSRRAPNGGTSGAGTGRAATWDQWGVFLGYLYDRDFAMTSGGGVYLNAAHFHYKTDERFRPRHSSESTSYWPEDAHGDHTWQYAGVPREQGCTKCSAIRRA